MTRNRDKAVRSGDVVETNFERITKSPEALAAWFCAHCVLCRGCPAAGTKENCGEALVEYFNK